MKPLVYFSDLVHKSHSCTAMPYGVGLVCAYAMQKMPGAFTHKLFKFTDDLFPALEARAPDMACFSHYIWNGDLTYETARRLKAKAPGTIIIFGGPHYPVDAAEQQAFLAAHPAVDFYVFREGEQAFAALFEALAAHGMDAAALKRSGAVIPHVHYLRDDALVAGPLLPLPENLDDFPSPYLTGLLDEFFPRKLTPLTQTTRGCPFRCTFCQDGSEHSSKVKRFSRERVDSELEYIAQRSQSPQLHWGDLNFGMYSQDLDTCRTIARLRDRYGWPQSLDVNGKNQKERVMEAARIIDGDDLSGGVVTLVAAVQSTDPYVLEQVKRQNVSTDDMVSIAAEGKGAGSSSFSEVILGLPGDSKRAHVQSIADLMEAGINVVRSHQFIMLSGSESAARTSRDHFQMQTRFRVTPRTVAVYSLFGETFCRPEIDEICVGNSTLSYQDYLESRMYNLTVEIFYNYGLFYELLALLRHHGLKISQLIEDVHRRIQNGDTPLTHLYQAFLRETQELFDSREAVEEFLARPGVIEQYQNGELGNNEQMLYRALAIFEHMDDCHDVAFTSARGLLGGQGLLTPALEAYLGELRDFSLRKKRDMLHPERVSDGEYGHDFPALDAKGFRADPLEFSRGAPVRLHFAHTGAQAELIRQYIGLYGLENYGLGNILGSQTNVNNFYRMVQVG